MRTTFVNTLTELAGKDEKIICVIGDTGFSVFEDFEAEFGDRFVNVGIAEQNFVSFGAGLAAMGMKPYIYNVVSFMTLRGMEQILLDVCYQENPVVLVGVGGGFAYATAGPTHHALSDIAMMTSIPNMTVACPGDPMEMRDIMLTSYEYGRPMYIRIGRSVDPVVHKDSVHFPIGKAARMCDGNDGTLFVTGTMLKTAVEATDRLRQDGLDIALYSMPYIKPIDEEAIVEAAMMHKPIYTLEEHSIIGGLGDSVGRVLLDRLPNEKIQLHKFGVKDTFAPVTGSREYLDEYFGIDVESVTKGIKNELQNLR